MGMALSLLTTVMAWVGFLVPAIHARRAQFGEVCLRPVDGWPGPMSPAMTFGKGFEGKA